MQLSNRLILPALLLACLIQPTQVFGVMLGQTDTFENGTTENWLINLLGMGVPPAAALPVNASAQAAPTTTMCDSPRWVARGQAAG